MEESPSGSLSPAPSLPVETAPMPRVMPLRAVGVTNDQPPGWITDDGLPPFDPDQPISPRNFPEVSTARGGMRFTRGPIIGSGGLTAPLPPEDDDPEADPPGWWDDAVRTYQEIEPIVLEPVEGALLEGTVDPFVWWARRILYALVVAATAAATIAWGFVLLSVVRLVWLELWF